MKATLAASAAVLAFAACSAAPAGSSGFGPGGPLSGGSTGSADTTVAASTATSAASASTTETGDASTANTSTGSGTSAASAPDLGTIPDVGSPLPEGCDGKKIDFVFVISNSNTMADQQEKLLAAFPGFMDAIESRDIDKHVLVTTSLPMWTMADCADCFSDCDKSSSPPECGAELTECDSLLGAGRTFPAGKGATNRRCDLVGDRRYITSQEVQVDAAFKCLAKVGLDGDDVFAVDAARAAISPALNAKGACNEGFLRKDALLVITIITDTGDADSIGPISDWVADFLLAKHNDPDAVYLLVITTDADIPGHLCHPNDPWLQPEGRFRVLVNAMPNASIRSICADSFIPFFEDALATILELCESFVPPQ